MKQFSKEELEQALAYNFSYTQFRPNQLEAIQATLAGRDSLLIMPTGGGKSMTFQLPSLAKSNCFTVVVGPLMALAKDQVDSCLDLGIDARAWNSDTSEEAKKGIQSDLVSDAPEMRLLYTTPESLRHPSLRGYLKEAYEAGTLLSFAIDEAHCVSEWGHDFRPAYLELSTLKQEFPLTPIAAMTASCTPTVEGGIIKLLGLQNPLVIKGGFNRPNIQYKVLLKELINEGKQDDLVEHLVEFIKQRAGQCGIIYARLRATCDWLGSALGSCDIDVGVYHAGKDAQRRRKVQQEWCSGGLDVVVATVAFGMGIDRSDCRFVVHWDVPASLEGFYQESGRAGRDGLPSEALLYVSADDLDTITKLQKANRAGAAAAVAAFSCQGGCRRKRLVEYFGQKRSPCDPSQGDLLCDYCSAPAATRALIGQWEQQLQRKAVALMLKEQQAAAAAAAASDDDEEGEEAQQQQQQQGQKPEGAAAAAGGWGGAGGAHGQRSNAAAAGVMIGVQAGRSNRGAGGKPRPGVWAPARAHCASADGAAAAAGGVSIDVAPAAFGGSSRSVQQMSAQQQQDENVQPETDMCGVQAGTASGAAGSMAGGVLLPQAGASSTQAAAATGAAVGGGDQQNKPQLQKRRLSRGQLAWGAFKAPRKQQDNSSNCSKGPLLHLVDADGDAEEDGDDGDVGAAQPQQPANTAAAAAAAAAPAVSNLQEQQPGGGSSTVTATTAAVGCTRVGLRKGAGRQGFMPPFKR